MIWIVYKTINKINNKIYIGVHKQVNEDFDGYIGCGVYKNDRSTYSQPKTHFQYAVHKYGTLKLSVVNMVNLLTYRQFQRENEKHAKDIPLSIWKIKKQSNLIVI